MNEMQKNAAAAIKVQAAVRGYLSRREAAANLIRNAAKRYLLRKSIEKVNQLTPLEMLTVLSSNNGGHIMDSDTGIDFDGPVGNIVAGVLVGQNFQKSATIIKIQALFRGYATKRVVEAMRPNLQAAREDILEALSHELAGERNVAMTSRRAAEAMRRAAVGLARSQLRFGLISVCLPALKEKNYWYPFRDY
jgi:hypothetical protein